MCYTISGLVLRLQVLLVSHMHENIMPIGRRTLGVPVRFVLHEALGLFFSLAVLNSLSTMLSFKFTVDFSSYNSSKFVVSQYSCPPKALTEILPFKLLQYRRQKKSVKRLDI